MKKKEKAPAQLADTVKLNGHSFLTSEVKKYKTVEEFVSKAESHWFEGDDNRDQNLREIWNMANPAPVADAAPMIENAPEKNENVINGDDKGNTGRSSRRIL